MATGEALAVLYFVALGALAPATAVPWRTRVVGAGVALAAAGAIAVASRTLDEAVRAWLPHVHLAAGYWIPALLTAPPAGRTSFERWLLGTERRLRPWLPPLPRVLRDVTELAYLACYPLVPLTFAVVWTSGGAADVDRFWVAVLAAGFTCYASLPWLVSRPPRFAAPQASPSSPVAAANVFVLGRVSHQLNTFPSGHVAVSVAAAGAVAPVSSTAGIVVAVVATAVAVGAIAGRYHYVTDVLLGAVVGGLALAVAFTASPL